MKSILFAAALALAPSTVVAQAAAATLPNTMDRAPAAAAAQTPVPAAAAAPATPVNPKAEATLRAIIAGAQTGKIDYSVMTDDLAAKVREQEAQVGALMQQFGALQSVNYVGVEGTADLFTAAFANQATQWIIGFDENDKVAALLFRPAP